MFDVWKLKWRRYWLQRSFAKKRIELRNNKAPGIDFESLNYEEYESMKGIEDGIDFRVSVKLLDEARALDAEVPSLQESGMWNRDDEDSVAWLTPKGRACVRKAVDEEVSRRRERRAWWWKTVIIPAISALTGLAGVITGLVAVLKK